MCSPVAQQTRVQSQVESYQRLRKWYLMPPCLTLSIITHGSMVKWGSPGNGVAPSPTTRFSCYWKGSLRVTIDYSRLTYLNTYYIYVCFCVRVWLIQQKRIIIFIFFRTIHLKKKAGALSVTVNVRGRGNSDLSSNPGYVSLHFTSR